MRFFRSSLNFLTIFRRVAYLRKSNRIKPLFRPFSVADFAGFLLCCSKIWLNSRKNGRKKELRRKSVQNRRSPYVDRRNSETVKEFCDDNVSFCGLEVDVFFELPLFNRKMCHRPNSSSSQYRLRTPQRKKEPAWSSRQTGLERDLLMPQESS